MFADESDNPCADCKWKARVNLCPIYAQRCKYDLYQTESYDTHDQGLDKTHDKKRVNEIKTHKAIP